MKTLNIILLLGFLVSIETEILNFKENSRDKVASSVLNDTTDIELDKNLLYEQFATSEEYTVWLEFYTKKLFYLDLKKNEVASVKLTKGRGPGEYSSIVGLNVIKDVVYLLDSQNMKLIKYDLTTSSFLEDHKLDKPILGLAVANSNLYSMEIFAQNKSSFFYEISDRKVESLENSSVTVNPLSNQKDYMGKLISNERFLGRVGILMNSLVLYDFEKKELHEFNYDNYKKEPEVGINSTNPIKLTMKLIDAEIMPNTNIMAIVGEGETKERKFQSNQIHYYDLKQRIYLDRITELDINGIDDIEFSKQKLIIYSKQESKLKIIDK